MATVGANAALGVYYAPKVDVTTFSFHSRGVTAGSMRSGARVATKPDASENGPVSST